MKKLKVIQYGINHEHANGKYISLGLMKDTFELVGVVDDTCLHSPSMPINRDLFKNEHFITPDEALNYPGLDAVVIEVPNLELVNIGKKFAERGIPMHLDKPAGESLEEYKELLDICRAKKVPLQMGYMYRGNPALNFMKKLIREHVLGDIWEVSMNMNHGYGGDRYQEYMGELKGGIMFNLGCHLIDYVVSTMGIPEEVTPFLKNTPGLPKTTYNNSLAVLEYPHGTVMLRACSKCGFNTRRWTFIGSNGRIEIEPPERFDGKPLELKISLLNPTEHFPAGDNVIKFPPQRDRYIEQLAELAKIVRGEMENPYTYEHDYQVHKVTLAASGYIKWK